MSKLKTMDELCQQNHELAELRARARDLAQRSKEFAQRERAERIQRKTEKCENPEFRPHIEALYRFATSDRVRAYAELQGKPDPEEIMDDLVTKLNVSLSWFDKSFGHA